MKIESTHNNIIVLKCEKQYELTSTFMRLQEYYESPKYRNKFPALEEFMDWYAEEYGNFTYMTDWNGFNIPGDIARKFFKGRGELFHKEERLQKFLKPWLDGKEKFYVLGVHEKENAIEHEMSHAFYHLDPAYRKEMDALVKKLPKSSFNEIKEYIIKDGYHPSVVVDEIVAYLATNEMTYTKKMFRSEIPWDNILEFQVAFEDRLEDYEDEIDD